MSRIVRRTRRDLREIAGHAPMSSDARSSILARAGVPVARDDEEVVMLEKNTYTVQRRPWAIPLAVAATVALGIAGIVLINNRSDEASDIAPAASTLPDDEVIEPVVEVSPTLLARAEEFDALMVEQDLPGLVFEDPTDVTDVYDFGYAPEPGEVRDYRAVEWAFEAGSVEARFALHEHLDDDRIEGERLTVTDGRGTPEGDAWIDAVIQTLVRLNEPDLPESQIVDLAADLAAGTGMYYEEVWGSVFVSGQPDSATFVVETGSMPYFTESDRADPEADVTAGGATIEVPDSENPFYREPFKKMQAAEFTALLEAEGFLGVDVDESAIVPSTTAQVFEWTLLDAAVDGRLHVSEFGVTEWHEREGWGLTLFVDEGRGTPEGDAYIAAAVEAMVQMHQPDLAQERVAELVAGLLAGDDAEQVGSTVFTSTVTDDRIEIDATTMAE